MSASELISHSVVVEVVSRIHAVCRCGVITDAVDSKFVSDLESSSSWPDWKEDRLRRWEALVPVLQAERKRLNTDAPQCETCQINMELRVGKYGPFWGCPNHRKSGCVTTVSVPKSSAALYVDPMADPNGYYLTANQLDNLRREWSDKYPELRASADECGYVFDSDPLTQAIASVESGRVTPLVASELMSRMRALRREINEWIAGEQRREAEKVLKSRRRSARFSGLIRGRK